MEDKTDEGRIPSAEQIDKETTEKGREITVGPDKETQQRIAALLSEEDRAKTLMIGLRHLIANQSVGMGEAPTIEDLASTMQHLRQMVWGKDKEEAEEIREKVKWLRYPDGVKKQISINRITSEISSDEIIPMFQDIHDARMELIDICNQYRDHEEFKYLDDNELKDFDADAFIEYQLRCLKWVDVALMLLTGNETLRGAKKPVLPLFEEEMRRALEDVSITSQKESLESEKTAEDIFFERMAKTGMGGRSSSMMMSESQKESLESGKTLEEIFSTEGASLIIDRDKLKDYELYENDARWFLPNILRNELRVISQAQAGGNTGAMAVTVIEEEGKPYLKIEVNDVSDPSAEHPTEVKEEQEPAPGTQSSWGVYLPQQYFKMFDGAKYGRCWRESDNVVSGGRRSWFLLPLQRKKVA